MSSVLIIVFMLVLVSRLAHSQVLTGKITGTVVAEDGAALPGVKVEISSSALMGVKAEITSQSGGFHFLNLSPGIYKIVFLLEGFEEVERRDIRVSAGITATVDTTLRLKTLEKSITVTATAPIIDVTKSGASTTFDRESIEGLPMGRGGYEDILKNAAGITTVGETGSGSRFSSQGSGVQSNRFYIDGVEVSSPEMGISWNWLHQDAMEEVEAGGLGAPAEYGQYTGAVINVITKSGGNTYQGSLGYYGQYDGLTGDNNPDTGELFSYKRQKFVDLQFSLGGPIIKDKIWFFSTGNLTQDVDTPWQSDPLYPTENKSAQIFFKLSSQLSPAHRIVASFNYQRTIASQSPSPWNLPETTTQEKIQQPTWNILYTWIISSKTYLDVKYAGWWSDDNDGIPTYGGDINNRPHYDLLTGVMSGAPWNPIFWDISKQQAHASLSHYAENFLGASHDLKLGVQYNYGWNHGMGGYSGGGLYYDYGGEPYLLYTQQQWQYGGKTNSFGAFIDDSIKVGARLTLNLGVRADFQNADYPSFRRMSGWKELDEKAPGIKDLVTWNVFSPRLGFAYALTKDNKTVFKAHYGRYYDALLISMYNWPGPGVTDWSGYQWTGTGWELFDLVQGKNRKYDFKKNPYADVFSLGLEREIFRELSAGVLFIYKNEKDLTGKEDRGATYEAVQRVSPDNGKTYTVYNQTSPPGTNEYWQTNPKGYDTTYRALILNLNKRYSNNWMMKASLTWSRSEGLICTAFRTGNAIALAYSAGPFGQDPTSLVNARGLLQMDRTWVFKLQLGYTLPWGILIGANYFYQTGAPYGTFVRVYDLNQAPYREVFDQPRGSSRRFDPWNKLDLRIEKSINIYQRLRLRVMADIFNVFNAGSITQFQSYNSWATNYRKGSQMLLPRRVQLGFQLEF